MKINYKNTALNFLEDPKRFSMHTPESYAKPMTHAEDSKLMYSIIEQFAQPGFADFFNKNIQYVTQPFMQAYYNSRDKLRQIVLKTPISDSGTLIIPWHHHTQTIFYRIVSKGNGDTKDLEAFIIMFTKQPKADSFGLDLALSLDVNAKETMDYVWKGFIDQGRDLTWWVADLMLFKTFLQYVEVETKIVNAEKKDYHIGVKYVNETKKKVEILDSTYFTTISRTEGFGVRGHFRWQAYGVGMKERRLQWISSFEKEGYTRKAKLERV